MLQIGDSFCFSAASQPQTGIERVMDAITQALEPHLEGNPAADHVAATLCIERGEVRISIAGRTSLGERALRHFSGEGGP